MSKYTLGLFFCLLSVITKSQDYSNLWEGHFSYLNIIDVAKGNDKVFAATDNVLFIYDITSQDIETLTTIDGLSGQDISAIHYSENYGLLLIGYENGLIELISDTSTDVLTVIDILEKPTIPPTSKRINHFN